MESTINYLAVLVSAVAFYALGALWYSPLLLGRPWMAAQGLTQADVDKGGGVKSYVGAFIAALVMAVTMAYLAKYSNAHDFKGGLIAGSFSWLGLVATTTAMNYLFAGRKLKLYLIDNGYYLVGLLIMGVIIAVWR